MDDKIVIGKINYEGKSIFNCKVKLKKQDVPQVLEVLEILENQLIKMWIEDIFGVIKP